jgi:hypothetical protein
MILLGVFIHCPLSAADSRPATHPSDQSPPLVDADILPPSQWSRIRVSVDRALAWLATRQQPDGSFASHTRHQPAATGLCVLAFMACGHLPGEGPYGSTLEKAVDFILACQQSDGLLCYYHPASQPSLLLVEAAAYDHAIGGLALAECYGTTADPLAQRIRPTLDKALALALAGYPTPKRDPADLGGWRYPRRHQSSDSDLDVTCWHLMFLRSCRNAGLSAPAERVDEAVAFVERCYDPDGHFFWFALRGDEHVHSRADTGAGILSLSLAGRHHTVMAHLAGDRLLKYPFDKFNVHIENNDRFYYGAFYCSQAMFQLGGRHWKRFFPVLARTLIDHQHPDGFWETERGDRDHGTAYSTALAVLTLTPASQLLPVFQR